MDGPSGQVDEALDDASSVLLLTPSASDSDDNACVGMLTIGGPSQANVLSATIVEPPGERVALWQRAVGDQSPNRGAIVAACEGRKQAITEDDAPDASDLLTTLAVDILPENAEPIDLGMALARYLGAWEAEEEPTVLCLHTLTALLDRFDRDVVISMVSALNDLCDSVGATAHHHMDPSAHDDEIVATFRPLYDAVVEHVPEDGWTVTRAPADVDRPSFRQSTAPPGGTAGTDPARPETIPMPYAFDQMLELISVPRRRTLLYHLKDRGTGTLSLDDLVDAVVTRERSIPARETPESADTVRVSLVHAHLPKLADLGILEFDPEDSTVRYHGNPALESFLRYVETLELG
ncbi:DUF7504 family protein [Haloplanus pelagicus]|jgi:hypothetical protein|uniref:DUF7504 family protein n=1 Tax=Haloplanus pelagicus TaxID=2949995 RepID=UPI00203B65EC|nr:hypothetical protein [Haloplanus sp. HW8-1]